MWKKRGNGQQLAILDHFTNKSMLRCQSVYYACSKFQQNWSSHVWVMAGACENNKNGHKSAIYHIAKHTHFHGSHIHCACIKYEQNRSSHVWVYVKKKRPQVSHIGYITKEFDVHIYTGYAIVHYACTKCELNQWSHVWEMTTECISSAGDITLSMMVRSTWLQIVVGYCKIIATSFKTLCDCTPPPQKKSLNNYVNDQLFLKIPGQRNIPFQTNNSLTNTDIGTARHSFRQEWRLVDILVGVSISKPRQYFTLPADMVRVSLGSVYANTMKLYTEWAS